MFIKVTNFDEDVVRVNVDAICDFYPEEKGAFIKTRIDFTNGKLAFVRETPEEIDAKIERVTNQTIGGGH